MALSTVPYLPPEILVVIAEHCTTTLTDQELWFDLGRVSSLFRTCVEKHITRDTYDRRALCILQEARGSAREEAMDLWCYDRVDMDKGGVGFIRCYLENITCTGNHLALFHCYDRAASFTPSIDYFVSTNIANVLEDPDAT